MDERTLIDWVRLLRDGWIALVLLLAAGAGVGVVATLLQPTEYRYAGAVVVSPARGFLDPSGADALPAVTNTVARLLETTAVLERTRSAYVSAGSDTESRARQVETSDITWLRDHLRAGAVAGVSIIRVSGTASTDSDARDLTRAAVGSLVQTVARSQPRESGAGIQARIFSLAESEGQVSPSPARNLLVGLNAGLVLGVVTGLGVGAARRRIRRPEEVAAALGVPLVASVRAPSRGHTGVDERMVEANAGLRTLFYGSDGEILLVTGTLAADKLTQVSEWIADSVAEAGARAVLVEAGAETAAEPEPLDDVEAREFADSPKGLSADRLALAVDDGPARRRSRWSTLPVGEAAGDPHARHDGSVRVLPLRVLNGDLDLLRGHHDAIVVSGPGVDRPAELIPLLRAADRVVVVAARGDRARRLEEANAFLAREIGRDKLAGAIVVDSARSAR